MENIHTDNPTSSRVASVESNKEKLDRIQKEYYEIKSLLLEIVSLAEGDRQRSSGERILECL